MTDCSTRAFDGCSTRAFDGCSCTDTCQSATVPIIDLDRKFRDRAAARKQQSSSIVALQSAMAAILALALVWLALVHSAVPESNRLVKANQENYYVSK